ncbi:MAG: hypothetical protein QNJ98_01965 [Planctomycetota bacterium]|nr:hypothetical protein [Planctomycetota bacterium]
MTPGRMGLIWIVLTLSACGEPPPDYDALIERASPGAKDEGQRAFRELLALRDSPDPRAVPALIEILRRHEGDGRTHRYAAALALCASDDPKAHAALERHVMLPTFYGRNAYRYTFHWESPGAVRDRFLSRYVLRTANRAPSLELRTIDLEGLGPAEFGFEVTIRNDTDAAMVMMHPASHANEMLVFRSLAGGYCSTLWPTTSEFLGVGRLDLAPGASVRVTARVQIVGVTEAAKAAHRNPSPFAEDANIGGIGGGYVYVLHQPGPYDVVAFWNAQDGSGRAVSAPLRVQIPAAK